MEMMLEVLQLIVILQEANHVINSLELHLILDQADGLERTHIALERVDQVMEEEEGLLVSGEILEGVERKEPLNLPIPLIHHLLQILLPILLQSLLLAPILLQIPRLKVHLLQILLPILLQSLLLAQSPIQSPLR